MGMAGPLFTIGYEGAVLPGLIRVLLDEAVEEVLDVRLTPISRKPGFSKTRLATALERRGIAYSHWPELGCPKSIRARYRRGADFEWYAKAYHARVLASQAHALREIGKRAEAVRICLLCFEAEALECHRSIVADEVASIMKRRRSRPIHLSALSSGRIRRAP